MSDLDPRALEEAARVIALQNSEILGHDTWGDLWDEQRDCQRSEAAEIITAYLAVTQPIVETVEELEGLPTGTVVQTVDEGETEVWITDGAGGQEWSLAGSCQRFSAALMPLPARVIWRPHESA